MGDDKAGAALHQSEQCSADARLRCRVKDAGCIVKQENGRPADRAGCKGQSLALAAGECHPAFPDDRFVAVGHQTGLRAMERTRVKVYRDGEQLLVVVRSDGWIDRFDAGDDLEIFFDPYHDHIGYDQSYCAADGNTPAMSHYPYPEAATSAYAHLRLLEHRRESEASSFKPFIVFTGRYAVRQSCFVLSDRPPGRQGQAEFVAAGRGDEPCAVRLTPLVPAVTIRHASSIRKGS